eukprot:CAMPEP_0115044636 /NCGR_PEP_ID=MMETSP0216-20121206/47630_1 /TAXON_ID=223996 /ORGANISM="Protocruzia adherens, Strain Boccale" /LENGTH=336 /DNA_ID=CAMNT_0002427281 /DNA_START=205 /DNA_END=1215 /DNA_ORIENTATION=+
MTEEAMPISPTRMASKENSPSNEIGMPLGKQFQFDDPIVTTKGDPDGDGRDSRRKTSQNPKSVGKPNLNNELTPGGPDEKMARKNATRDSDAVNSTAAEKDENSEIGWSNFATQYQYCHNNGIVYPQTVTLEETQSIDSHVEGSQPEDEDVGELFDNSKGDSRYGTPISTRSHVTTSSSPGTPSVLLNFNRRSTQRRSLALDGSGKVNRRSTERPTVSVDLSGHRFASGNSAKRKGNRATFHGRTESRQSGSPTVRRSLGNPSGHLEESNSKSKLLNMWRNSVSSSTSASPDRFKKPLRPSEKRRSATKKPTLEKINETPVVFVSLKRTNGVANRC